MRRIVSVALAATFVSCSFTLPVAAQQRAPQTLARPVARITQRVDDTARVQLRGTHPSVVEHAQIGARLATSTPLQHLTLVLSPSEDQESALQQLMAEQQDRTSPNYHQWLTPESFGEHFGIAPSDLAKVQGWLESEGLTVEKIAPGGRFITFAGSAGTVEAAFGTQINHMTVNGEAHVSNVVDVHVPEALAGVVRGVASLNDFRPKSNARVNGSAQLPILVPANSYVRSDASPLYSSSGGTTHYITPGDTAAIYNTTPLASAGFDGTGQTVAVLAQSNVKLADVQKFRSMFGLVKNDPTFTYVDSDPGENADDFEAFLDIEWAGALAPAAKINFIVSSPNYFSGGVDAAALYAVSNNVGDVISLSYGGCEYNNGAPYTAFWNQLWEQAAAQGQTAFVSSGDSGAAGCVSSSATSAGSTAQYSVNSLGSSAYNVAVGGSIFVDWNPSQYWNSATGAVIPFANATTYIPEAALNQSRLAPTLLNSASTAYTIPSSGVFAAGGGISIYTARPAWQTGSGISASADTIGLYSPTTSGATGLAGNAASDGTHRLVPDLVNISANGHDGTLVCASSLCVTNSDNSLGNAAVVGGTSVATPVQAGIQALINSKLGGRQGNVLPVLYRLANAQYTASTTACQATLGTTISSTPTPPASTCNFHDVVGGSITVPTTTSGTTGIGFLAAVGFDEASGLGSMNVANVANNWNTVSMAGSKVSFTLSPTTGITHGSAQTLNVTVSPSTGTGTPTGDVALVVEGVAGGPRLYKLTAGAYAGPVSGTYSVDGYGDTALSALPGGTYNVHVHYGGDATYTASDSSSVAISIGKENATVTLSPYAITTGTNRTAATTFIYGSTNTAIYVATNLSGTSGNGIPTGTVTYSLTRNGSAISPITVNVDASGQAYFYSGFAIPTYYLLPNYPQLQGGTYVLTASYSGDASFNATSSQVTLTVTPGTPTVTFTAPAGITSGQSATFGYKIALPTSVSFPNTAVVYATGSVSFVDTTTSTTLGSCTLDAVATCSFTTTGITGGTSHSINAVYAGDANYATATNSATVAIGTNTAPTVTISTSGTLTATTVISLKATLNPTAATGSVAFYDGSTLLGSATLSSGVATLALGSTGTGYGTLTGGTHNVTAVYSGSASYAAASGTGTVTVAQATTVLALSVPANSTYGQPVVASVYLTRSVSTGTTRAPALQPTGVVTFSDNGTPFATGALSYDPAGYAYYAASGTAYNLTGGSHSITASYAGDTNYASSSVAGQPLTVAALTPTIVVSATNSVFASGATETLTVTIPVASSTLAVPTGTLTFYDGASVLGTGTLAYSAGAGGFVATYSGVLSKGAHALSAQLTSDANYNAATSSTLAVTVVSNNVWVANGNGTVSAVSSTGAAVTPSAVSQGGTSVAIDHSGNVWSLNNSGNKVTEYDNAGNMLTTLSGGGISAPTALAIDGAGLVWVTNGTGTLSAVTASGAVSPSSGYSVSASTPTSVTIDSSGNLWITNSGNNSVTEVFGAATPVTTPTANAVKNDNVAAKP